MIAWMLACAVPDAEIGPPTSAEAERSPAAAAWITDGAMEVQEDATWTYYSCSCGDSGSGDWTTSVVAWDVEGELQLEDGLICAWTADRIAFTQREVRDLGYGADELAVDPPVVEGFRADEDCPVQDAAWFPDVVVEAPRVRSAGELWLFGVIADRTEDVREERSDTDYEMQDAWTTTGESHRWWRIEPLLTGPPVPLGPSE